MPHNLLILLTISASFTVAATGRLITTTTDLVSDGLSSMNELQLCEQTYGFLPCNTTVLGNLFLVLVYGYLMFLAATFLSSGSELMLEILGPGIVGGLFLPILGALPDAMLILGSGVSTDIWTSYSAMIMAVSVLPFIVVQFPQIFHSTSGRHLAVLIGLIVSVSLLIAYCVYQVYQPNIQKRRIAFAKHKHVRSGILRYLKTNSLGRLTNDQNQLDRDVLYKLFNSVDLNKDGHLSLVELRALVVGMQLNAINLNEDDAIDKIMKEFDTSGDEEVDFQEFVTGIANWLEEARRTKIRSPIAGPDYIHDYHEETKRQHYLLGDEGGDDEDNGAHDARRTTAKAVLLLLLGTLVAAVFADPLVDAVDGFSTATSIPSFFISFIALPLATNSSESVSAIIFASRKKRRSASLTFSELYGAATMNNILCLSVFLALVYVRGLTWDFSSEVLVIVIVCVVMGIFGSLRTTFPLWTSFIAFVLYPFSLVLVYVLDYVFGWS